MNTPVLTEKQQRQSLSAKKGPVKGARNVLAQPYTTYWPVVKGDQHPELQDLLKELIPPLKRPKVPWSELRRICKEQRPSVKKQKLIEMGEPVVSKDVLKSAILGVNAITRALEKKKVCCVLLDANVKPQLLIRHIVIMAQNQKIPVLLIPFLKSIASECIGFPTAAFALQSTVEKSEDNHFYKLYKKVLDVSSEFPLPKNPLQLVQHDLQDNESISSENEMMDVDEKPENETKKEEIFTVSKNVYKYRSSTKERVFVPKAKESSVDNTVSQQSDFKSDFISLGNESDESDSLILPSIPKNSRYINIHDKKDDKSKNVRKQNSKQISEGKKRGETKASYVSLKIKRLQGNSNRIKATKLSKKKKKDKMTG